jgi:hypothetical protein
MASIRAKAEGYMRRTGKTSDIGRQERDFWQHLTFYIDYFVRFVLMISIS